MLLQILRGGFRSSLEEFFGGCPSSECPRLPTDASVENKKNSDDIRLSPPRKRRSPPFPTAATIEGAGQPAEWAGSGSRDMAAPDRVPVSTHVMCARVLPW